MTKLDDFVNEYEPKNTKKDYRSRLGIYHRYFKIEPDKYLTTNRNYEEDIRKFHKHLKEQKYSQRTRGGYLILVKTYLAYHDVELKEKFWKSLRKSPEDKGRRAATLDQPCTPEQLRKLLDHASTLMRAVILTLTSSGMRPCELIGFTPNDLHLSHDPPYITLGEDITKNHVSRYVFVSYEARDAINAWMRERDEWLKRASRKMQNLKTVEKTTADDRVFPMTVNHINITLNRILKNAELNERDQHTKKKIRTYHLYTTRKYFRSYLTPAIQGGSDIVHALMGHDEYLDSAYRRYNLEQLSKMYKDAMPAIAVYDRKSDLKDVTDELKAERQRVTELERKIDDMNQDLVRLLTKIQTQH